MPLPLPPGRDQSEAFWRPVRRILRRALASPLDFADNLKQVRVLSLLLDPHDAIDCHSPDRGGQHALCLHRRDGGANRVLWIGRAHRDRITAGS